MTKRCSRCQQVKDAQEFWKNVSAKDGLQSYCRPCHVVVDREWSERRPEVSRRRRLRLGSRYRSCPPEARAAHHVVGRAIRTGILERPSVCSQCGKSDSPIHAHHERYDRPLEVRWLCARCHRRLHHGIDLVPALPVTGEHA